MLMAAYRVVAGMQLRLTMTYINEVSPCSALGAGLWLVCHRVLVEAFEAGVRMVGEMIAEAVAGRGMDSAFLIARYARHVPAEVAVSVVIAGRQMRPLSDAVIQVYKFHVRLCVAVVVDEAAIRIDEGLVILLVFFVRSHCDLGAVDVVPAEDLRAAFEARFMEGVVDVKDSRLGFLLWGFARVDAVDLDA
jgi:hypothetical protein